MIETQGGLIPLICHLFLIAFTGFFGLSCLFNGKKLSQNFGFRDDQEQVAVAFRPLGFAFTTFSLVLIAQLLQFVITSSFEIYTILLLFLYLVLSVIFLTILRFGICLELRPMLKVSFCR